jgi:hypothetical protein
MFLPDSPVTSPQLSQRERRLAVERLRNVQTGIENRNMKSRRILEALTDWKVWTFIFARPCESTHILFDLLCTTNNHIRHRVAIFQTVGYLILEL